MKIIIKNFLLKFSNGIIIGFGFILAIGLFSLVHAALTRVPQSSVLSGSRFTSTMWNDMINNISFLKESVEGVVGKFGTLTSGKMCTTDGTKVNCNTTIPTSGITTEIDPKVGTLTSGKMCTTDGTKVNCNTTIPTSGITTEIDPQVGTLIEGKICTSIGGKVDCSLDIPSTLTLQTQITNLQTQIDSLETRACPIGYTIRSLNSQNLGEDIYPASGVVGNVTDTCDGNKAVGYSCLTTSTVTCRDTYYNWSNATYYYRTVTCRLAYTCQ